MLFLIRELKFNVSVNLSGSGKVGLGVGVGSYQPGVYVHHKALFLVFNVLDEKKIGIPLYTPVLLYKSGMKGGIYFTDIYY